MQGADRVVEVIFGEGVQGAGGVASGRGVEAREGGRGGVSECQVDTRGGGAREERGGAGVLGCVYGGPQGCCR
jgi:hypothetical protein